MAAGGEGLPVQALGGVAAAEVLEVPSVQHPILTGHDGGATGEYTGEALMNEVFDLMRRRLPELLPDDPYRARLMVLLPPMGAALGRDRLVPVGAGLESHLS